MSTKAFIGILTGIILIVVVYYSLPKSGRATLEAEVAAMNGARSWRIRTEMRRQNNRLDLIRTEVAICPDKEHIVEQLLGATTEYIRIGDEIYYRQGNSPWLKGTPNGDLFFHYPTARPCLTNPNEPNAKSPGGAEEWKQWISEDIKESRITRGDLKFHNDGNCREWTVTRRDYRFQSHSYVVCIGDEYHLPRNMTRTQGFVVTHYDWNPSVVIEPPDMNARPGQAAEMP
jgi:hypothetical protein